MRGAILGITTAVVMCAQGLAVQCGRVEGALIVAYDSVNSADGLAASETASGITGLELTRGPGVTQASGGTYNSRGWTSQTSTDADDYLQWGWSAADAEWDLEQLQVRYDRSGTGPAQLEIQLSVDGGLFETIFSDSSISSAGESQLAISLSAIGVKAATFRLFAFDATSASGTLDLENFQAGPNRAVAVHGSTAAVPEPGGFILTLVSATLALLRRLLKGLPRRTRRTRR